MKDKDTVRRRIEAMYHQESVGGRMSGGMKLGVGKKGIRRLGIEEK